MKLSKAISILEDREEYLTSRIEKCEAAGFAPHYDLAERSAVQMALRLMRKTFDERPE